MEHRAGSVEEKPDNRRSEKNKAGTLLILRLIKPALPINSTYNQVVPRA
jgi:hypothetical protein